MAAHNSAALACSERTSASLRVVLDVLEEAFAARFQLWTNQVDWHPDTQFVCDDSTETLDIDADQLKELLEHYFRDDKPVVTPVSNARNLVVIPIDAVSCAVAVVAGHDTKLLERLTATALLVIEQKGKLDERRDHIDAFSEQVSYDFEELTWLRGLAEHIEYCESTNAIETVANAVLPSLRDLIRAEAIVLLTVERRANVREYRYSRSDRPTFESGETVFDEDVCRRLVACFGPEAMSRPVVINYLSEKPEFADVLGLSSCVLVSVGKDDYAYGWLLALNRVEPFESLIGNPELAPRGSSEMEFGTFEASLMAAAAVMLATHARNADLFQEKEVLLIGVIRSLINAIDAKDAYTCGHSERVALTAKRLAAELGKNRRYCEQIYMTGLLHDIGKIGVPDDVLLNPGKLTTEEFDKIKQHPVIGHSILRHLEQLSYVLPGVLHHHESVDGRGYPHQLTGDKIPLSARILAVADAYDAMTSSRPYRDAIPSEKAESILQENAGTQWDVRVVEAFFRALDDIHTISQTSAIGTEKLFQTNSTASNDSSDPQSDSIVAAVTATRE